MPPKRLNEDAENDYNGPQIALVFQAGLCNVFLSPEKVITYKRMRQSSFADCCAYAKGCKDLGARVVIFWLNETGDVHHRPWNSFETLSDAPFYDKIITALIRESLI